MIVPKSEVLSDKYGFGTLKYVSVMVSPFLIIESSYSYSLEGISLERVCAHPFTCAWVALLTYSAHAVRCSLLPCLPSHST